MFHWVRPISLHMQYVLSNAVTQWKKLKNWRGFLFVRYKPYDQF